MPSIGETYHGEALARRHARRPSISSADAMRRYFSGRLCGRIEEGACGIQRLDASCLVDDLFEHEPELFAHGGYLR